MIGAFTRSTDNFVSVIRFITQLRGQIIDDLRWIGSKCGNYSRREENNRFLDCSIPDRASLIGQIVTHFKILRRYLVTPTFNLRISASIYVR